MKDDGKFFIRNSAVGGNGVFSKVKINPGDFIKTLTGEFIDEGQFLERFNNGDEAYDDPLQIDQDHCGIGGRYIDLDELSRTFNHSCDPNSGVRNLSDLIAIKDIAIGDEITYDYATTVSQNEEVFSMQCRCGSDRCRGTIGNVLTIPGEQMQRYIQLNVLPEYIKKQLNPE